MSKKTDPVGNRKRQLSDNRRIKSSKEKSALEFNYEHEINFSQDIIADDIGAAGISC